MRLIANFSLTSLVAACLLNGCASSVSPWSSGRWVDLTHSFSAATLYWPTSETFHLDTVFAGTTEKGFHYETNRFQASEHGGTHLDAPNHFAEHGISVDQIPIERLMGPVVVVDVSASALADRDYRVGVGDFTAWENKNGAIPEGAIVLLRTGYDRYWPDPVKYLGTAERGPGAVAKLRFPGLDPAGAEWLAAQRHIKAVGLDTASIDYGQSTLFESHQTLAKNRVAIFENVDKIGELPAKGAMAIALPMKIEGGSGAPLRLIAWAPEK